jgi:hypothetical protein
MLCAPFASSFASLCIANPLSGGRSSGLRQGAIAEITRAIFDAWTQ